MFINKKASFEYELIDKFEAGIKLKGSEIKSVRLNNISINDTYCIIRKNKVFIINMFIKQYEYSNIFNHEERRQRELLLHKSEIRKIDSKIRLNGYTLVCTKAYFKRSLLKLEITLARGKNLVDKRNTIKKREQERDIKKVLKYKNR